MLDPTKNTGRVAWCRAYRNLGWNGTYIYVVVSWTPFYIKIIAKLRKITYRDSNRIAFIYTVFLCLRYVLVNRTLYYLNTSWKVFLFFFFLIFYNELNLFVLFEWNLLNNTYAPISCRAWFSLFFVSLVWFVRLRFVLRWYKAICWPRSSYYRFFPIVHLFVIRDAND